MVSNWRSVGLRKDGWLSVKIMDVMILLAVRNGMLHGMRNPRDEGY